MTDIAASGARPTVTGVLAWTLLASVLVFACASGMIGPYVAMGAAALSLLVVRDGPDLAAVLRNRMIRLFLLAAIVLAIAFAATMQTPTDLLAILDFASLLLSIPAFALLSRGAHEGATTQIAWLALTGVLVGVVGGLLEITLLYPGPSARASGGFSSIFYADLGAMLGFLALIGLVDSRPSRHRYLFALGPVLGACTVLLGASRGALLVYLVLAVLSVVIAAIHFRRWLAAVAVAALAMVSLAVPAGMFGMTRMTEIVTLAQDAIEKGETTDSSTNYRLEFYRAGLQAFADSPIVGHGWWRRVSAAVPYMNETAAAYEPDYRIAHLHNDIINFGSAAGLFGIGAYLLIIAAPLVGAWQAPRDSQYRARFYAALGLSVGFFTAGLTDAMFVYEIPKTFFAFVAVILIAYCRDRGAVFR